MMPADVPVWDRWLALHRQEFDTFLYDVRVGEGADMSEAPDHALNDAYKDLTKKRIDVIARSLQLDLIIEVKDVLTFTALGQIIAYPILYERTHKPTRSVGILLLGASIMNDLPIVLETLQVPYEIV